MTEKEAKDMSMADILATPTSVVADAGEKPPAGQYRVTVLDVENVTDEKSPWYKADKARLVYKLRFDRNGKGKDFFEHGRFVDYPISGMVSPGHLLRSDGGRSVGRRRLGG